MTAKDEIKQAYIQWYKASQLDKSGCGGPTLMACGILAFVFYLILK